MERGVGVGGWKERSHKRLSLLRIDEKPDPGEVGEEGAQGCGLGWSGVGLRGSIRILLTVNTVGGQRPQRTGLLLGKMLGAGGGGMVNSPLFCKQSLERIKGSSLSDYYTIG